MRYQVHLYSVATGALEAIMDAQFLTTLRTGATSAVATRRLARPGPHDVALLGSGAEAKAQLEAMQAPAIVKSAKVFSPTAANRAGAGRRLPPAARHGDHATSPAREEAVEGATMVLAAVKSTRDGVLGRAG